MKLSTIFAFILMLCCCAAFCAELSDVINGDLTDLGTIGMNGTRQSAVGAVPELTEAEELKEKEKEFQEKLAQLLVSVDAVDKRIMELRKQALAPQQQDLDRIDQELGLAEQQLDSISTLSLSSLAQLQQSELRDRIFNMNMTMDIMKRRWKGSWTVFGIDFFANAPAVSGVESHGTPANYKIRPGDKLCILTTSALGAQNDYHLEVASNGTLIVSGAGRVTAAGRTIRQFSNLLSSRITSKFKQLRVDVTIEGISSIQVQVAGEVEKPGTYVMSGMATVFSALHRAGGPTKAGTFRRIALMRDGEPERIIDLYELLLNGNKKQDIPLEDGDLIFVRPVGKTITVGGEVTRPGRYEPNIPINLGQALKLAGGVKPGGYLQTVQVERVENSEYKTLLSAPVTSDDKSSFKLQAGDEVTVTSVRPDRTNQVSISGLVSSPGVYGFKSGMHVADLIKVAQGLSQDREVYGGRADILRIEPLKGTELVTFSLDKALQGDPANNMLLQKLDRVFIYSPEQVVFRPMLITINGAVVNPGTYKRSRGMRVSDVIAAAGGTLPAAYLVRADLVRHREDDKTELVRVDLQTALNGDPGANVDLHDRDELTIYTTEQAGWRDRTVRVEGAVQRAGVYRRSEQMRVSDLIFAAGGVLPEGGQMVEVARRADSGQSVITRVELGKLASGSDADTLLQDGDIVTIPSMNPYLRAPEVVYITGEVAKPGPYVLIDQNEKLSDVIARAGGLTSTADSNGLLFLRKKENFQNLQQEQDADVVLKKAKLFADKEFMMVLGKMGVRLPDSLLFQGAAAQEQLAKPAEVVPVNSNTSTASNSATNANGISQADVKKANQPEQNVSETVSDGMYRGSMKQKAREVAENSQLTDKEIKEDPDNPFGPPVATTDSQTQQGYVSGDALAIVADSARISVSLSKALQENDSPDNLTMRSGDRIFIPKQTNVVTVMGAVLHPHSFAAGPGQNADYYIQRSGGYSQEAAKGHVIVVRANGDALPKNSVRSVEPGDIVVVPSTGLVDISSKWERMGTATKVISDVLSSVFVLTRF